MGEHIRTVGYLLKNYTKSQCYNQYVDLEWLKGKIQKRIDEMSLYDADCEMKGYEYILELLKHEQEG